MDKKDIALTWDCKICLTQNRTICAGLKSTLLVCRHCGNHAATVFDSRNEIGILDSGPKGLGKFGFDSVKIGEVKG